MDLDPDPRARILGCFPGLGEGSFEIIGEATDEYNCIAWAAGDTAAWWWPSVPAVAFWPDEIPDELTLEAFIQAFTTLGYLHCDSSSFDRRFEKIAIYVKDHEPCHAARQLPDGRWSSKLGTWECITHELDALEGDAYGRVVCLMSRRRSTWRSMVRDRLSGAMKRCWRLMISSASLIRSRGR
jgi:hypothetical protein